MGQGLHQGSARTTEAVRRAIQHSQESSRALDRRRGVNPKTIAKWRSQVDVAEGGIGPGVPFTGAFEGQPRRTTSQAQRDRRQPSYSQRQGRGLKGRDGRRRDTLPGGQVPPEQRIRELDRTGVAGISPRPGRPAAVPPLRIHTNALA